ncbi:MAG: PAS domain S-box protein [Hyphomicrobiaceae bacterium]
MPAEMQSALSILASAGGIAAYSLDKTGTILSWTPGATALFGYAEEDIVGQSVQRLIPDEHRESFRQYVSQLDHQQCIRVRTVRRRRNGTDFAAEISACRIRASDGEDAFAVVVRDVQQVAPEPQKAALITSIIEASSDAIASVDASGTVLTWNPAAEKLFGYTAAEMIGNSMRPLFPQDRQWAFGMGATELAKGRRLMHDTVRMHKDGTEIPVSLVASPLIASDGVYLGYSVIFRSIAEKQVSLAALRDAERFNQRVLAASRDWISVIDLSGRVMFLNPVGQLLLGAKPDDGLEKIVWADAWPEADRNLIAAHVQVAIGGEPSRFEAELTAADGNTYAMDVTVTPITDESGKVMRVLALAHDETEKRRQRRHLDLVVRELSHRVKNLLAVISGMARSSVADDMDVHRFQSDFYARIRSLAKSHDLLVGTDWRGIEVADLIRSQLSAFVASDIDPRIAVYGPPTLLRPEPAQMLGLAFHELATNASKYGALAHAGGRLSVTWSRTASDDGTQALQLVWREQVPVPIAVATRFGFGSEVLNEIVAEMLEGTSVLDFESEGVTWTLVVDDLTHIAVDASISSSASHSGVAVVSALQA